MANWTATPPDTTAASAARRAGDRGGRMMKQAAALLITQKARNATVSAVTAQPISSGLVHRSPAARAPVTPAAASRLAAANTHMACDRTQAATRRAGQRRTTGIRAQAPVTS